MALYSRLRQHRTIRAFRLKHRCNGCEAGMDAGMQEKLKELAALIGDEEAKAYQPFIDKTIEDNKAYEQKKAAKKQKK